LKINRLINLVQGYLKPIFDKLSNRRLGLSTLQHTLYVSYRIVGENEIHAARHVLKLNDESATYKKFIYAIGSGLDVDKYLTLELNKTEQYLKFKSSIYQRISFIESYNRNMYLRSVDRLKVLLTIFTFLSFIIPFVFIFLSFFLFKNYVDFLSYFILLYPIFLSFFLRLARVEDKYVIK